MEVTEAILTRRSIRHYTNRAVPDDLVSALLAAAMNAPSAGNEQPWHFVVIRDRGILDAIPAFHPYSRMVLEASVAILVCGDERLEKHAGFWVQDCSAATMNILLAAHGHGLGAVWVGIYPNADRVAGFRKLCNLPERVIPLALVPLGYADEEREIANRFDPMRVHNDRW